MGVRCLLYATTKGKRMLLLRGYGLESEGQVRDRLLKDAGDIGMLPLLQAGSCWPR
jgi:hypothetical protein